MSWNITALARWACAVSPRREGYPAEIWPGDTHGRIAIGAAISTCLNPRSGTRNQFAAGSSSITSQA